MRRTLAFLCAMGVSGTGCAATPPPPSRVEDKARLDVPIAICRKPLLPSDLGDGGAPGPEGYFSVIFPSFRSFGTPLGARDPDCVGETYANGAQVTPRPISPADAILVPGDDVDIVWLRAFQAANRVAEGPLALARARPSELDVYAIGDYRGVSHSRFSLARLGSARVIVASDDACADVKVGAECESLLTLYVALGGKISPAATSPAERIHYGTQRNLGRVQYRLTTDPPAFDKSSMTVHERLQVRDSGDEDVRKAEGDRVFVLGPDGRVTAQQESLWSQVPAGP